MTKHGVSYIVLNGTMILKRASELKLGKFLLDYGEFPLGAHSAKNTETWWAGIHTHYGIRPLIDVVDPTVDGASNGKAGRASCSSFRPPRSRRGAARTSRVHERRDRNAIVTTSDEHNTH